MKTHTAHKLYLNATSSVALLSKDMRVTRHTIIANSKNITTGKRYRCGAPGAFGGTTKRNHTKQ